MTKMTSTLMGWHSQSNILKKNSFKTLKKLQKYVNEYSLILCDPEIFQE